MQTVDVLVTYDVNTETSRGRKRLKQVATICLGYGQRVQYSVFECRVTRAQLEELEDRLVQTINAAEDRLRIYRLAGPPERYVRVWGREAEFDVRETLIL